MLRCDSWYVTKEGGRLARAGVVLGATVAEHRRTAILVLDDPSPDHSAAGDGDATAGMMGQTA